MSLIKRKAMDHTRRAVMPLIVGDVPRCFGCLHVLEQIGMITFFDPEDIATARIVQGLDVGALELRLSSVMMHF